MQRKRTSKDAKERTDVYEQVFNANSQRVRGIWAKGGTYYAQLDANDGKQYRYRLEQAKTVPQAVLARQALKAKQQAGKLFPPGASEKEGRIDPQKEGRTSKPLATVIDLYKDDRDILKKKDEATARRENSSLGFWKKKFGTLGISEVKNTTLTEFAKWRKKQHQVSGRAIDLDVIALNHVFNYARTTEILPKDHPEFQWTNLADKPSKDELLTPEQMEEFCRAALLHPEALELIDSRVRHLRAAQAITGQAFYDYLRLLQYAGSREHETCLQQWPNVTWSRRAKANGDGGTEFKKGDLIPGTLFFPGENAKAGGGKPAEDRWVDLHPDLESHLKAMHERRDPSYKWMFPGRIAGRPIKRFNKQLDRVKRSLRDGWSQTAKKSELNESQWFDRVTFQWLRHYFISHAVMAGIDYKTIAYWVSHRDGGVLIGRLYGHLDQKHSRQMAAKLAAHLESRR